jgi:hypothetical protein
MKQEALLSSQLVSLVSFHRIKMSELFFFRLDLQGTAEVETARSDVTEEAACSLRGCYCARAFFVAEGRFLQILNHGTTSEAALSTGEYKR